MAPKYWVGGTDVWDGNAGLKWADFSGGPGGSAVPTSADAVFADAASGAVTITISTATAQCASFDATGFTGTIAGNAQWQVFGNFKLVPGMAGFTFSSTISLRGAGAHTFDSGGKSMGCNITVEIGGGTYTIQAAHTCTQTVTLTNGTLITGAFTHNWARFASNNVNVRALNLLNTTVNITSTAGTLWDVGNFAGMTLTSTGSTINFLNGATTVALGDLRYNTLSWTGNTAGTVTITGNFLVATLSQTAANANSDNYTYAGNPTILNALTLTGFSLQNRGAWSSSVPGTRRIFTYLGAAGNCNIANWDFQDAACQSFTWPGDAGNIGDRGNNGGITARTVFTRYLVMGAANQSWSSANIWATVSGGAGATANFPLPQDTLVIDGSSNVGARTFTINYPTLPTLDAHLAIAGFSLLSSTAHSVYGSISLSLAMTVTLSQATTMAGRGAMTLTSNGHTLNGLTVQAGGGVGSVTLADALTVTGTITIASGTFNSAGKTIGCAALTPFSSFTRTVTLDGSAINLSGAIGTCFQNGTTSVGLTWSAVGCVWTLTTGGVLNYSCNLGGIQNLDLGASFTIAGAGTGNVVFGLGTFAIGTLAFTRGNAIFITHSGMTIKTAWAAGGSAGGRVALRGPGSSTLAPVTYTGSGIISTDWMDLQDSQAVPAGYWYAGANSLNNGNDPGWIFGTPLTALESTSGMLGVGG